MHLISPPKGWEKSNPLLPKQRQGSLPHEAKTAKEKGIVIPMAKQEAGD